MVFYLVEIYIFFFYKNLNNEGVMEAFELVKMAYYLEKLPNQ